ncbi:putative short-chain type dehydrogenase/reductase y4lA [Novosphingobium endophyticum]|uniref:Short-chain type dehydrogenase/reductase y4lA n=1 Tax=Novosphingobium endophyticum TaxID=1955250 RepID=A0A916TTI5_9SPHN|nr:SDR family oxidoreductase [Novosphingobium endophyticum]GGC01273.1 putative short-chain type dehydrogenase/reductase y4lA [Novosphingobium endophyticum]
MTDATSLTDKVAIITGGAGGIGSETARLMARRGAKVAVADINLAGAQEVADAIGEQAIAVELDLGSETSIRDAVAKVVEAFGKIDILHNNAALAGRTLALDGSIGDMPTEVWDQIFAVNCRGTMLMTRECLPHLIATQGSIVNTVSGLGLQGHVRQAAYSATKAAIMQMTRSIATAYGPKGVRCNAVAPGLILTPTTAKDFPDHWRRNVEAETPRGIVGAPEDIAEPVAFLASDAARNITGQTLASDGGVSIHVPGFSSYAKTAWD